MNRLPFQRNGKRGLGTVINPQDAFEIFAYCTAMEVMIV